MKKKKVFVFIITGLVMAVLCSITVFADGEVANAVSNTWTRARGQIKSIVNDVVFPVIDVVLAILLFVKISTSYMDYRKHGQFEWTAPADFVRLPYILPDSSFVYLVYSGNVIKEQV